MTPTCARPHSGADTASGAPAGRSGHISSAIVAFATLGAVAPTIAYSSPPPATLSEVVTHWKQLQEWDDRGGEYRVESRAADEPNRPASVHHLKVRQDSWSYRAEYNGSEGVYARSPLYQFLAWKQPNNPAWAVRTFHADSRSSKAEAFERETGERKTRYPLSVVITVSDKRERNDPTLYEMATQPDFRYESITRQLDGLDRIEFRTAHTAGTFITDPARFHVVVRSTIRGKPPGPNGRAWVAEMTSRELFETKGRDEQLRCRRIDYVMADADNNPRARQHETHDFSDYRSNEIPDTDFMMSAYGLPEPVGITPPAKSRLWILLVGAAAAGLMIALLFTRLNRRVAGRE